MQKSLFAFLALAVLGVVAGAAWFSSPVKEREGWLEDDRAALTQAKAENKLLLVDVGGSTWCPMCMALDREVYAKKKFQDYAKKYVRLKIDFPSPTAPPNTGEAFISKYLPGEIALPTVLVVTPDGKLLGKTTYTPGGPDAFIKELEKIANR